MRRSIATAILIAVASATAASAYRQPSTESTRLAMLGRVWLGAKFSHPRVALTTRDWDYALVDVLPKVRGAADADAFAQAVATMLATLDDPVTRVVKSTPGASFPERGAGGAKLDASDPQMTTLDLRGRMATNPQEVTGLLEREAAAVNTAGRLVIDLRGTAQPFQATIGVVNAIAPALVSEDTALPAARHITHSGYRAQAGGAGFYSSQQVLEAAAKVAPRNPLKLQRVVFVVDRFSAIPPIALAMRARGRAAFLVHGEEPRTPVATTSVQLEDGWVAILRVNDLVLPDGRVEMKADATVAATATDADVHAAAKKLFSASLSNSTVADPSVEWRPEETYATPAYPSDAHRLIAVYRLWGVMDAFFPYKHLLDKPWDGVLEEFVPQALAAQDALQYAQVMARMAARTQDSHVGVSGSAELSRLLGTAPPPFVVRYIEGKPIVTRIMDPKETNGIVLGDEIVSVDGVSVADRARQIEQHTTHSTPAARDRTVAGRLLSGEDKASAKLMIRGADGSVREVSVPRSRIFSVREQRDGPVFRMLEHNIGYADLDRLETADVPKAFDQFANAAAIVFDMRGYPRGTAWAIAPRINTKKPAAAAMFFRPILTAGSSRERLSFMQELPPTTTPVYSPPTVMLIDDRAISQAEHTGLFFKAANGTTFIGSPTMGANGDVTTLVLPGNLRVSFTGHDVRWPDGRQLQRVGLQPDVEVRPTIAGVRAGRDEVLERAVEWLKTRGASSNAGR
jgi:C-terminal processing protease CtpA/Prc